MIAALVFGFSVLRAVALGYGGAGFAAPVLTEALLPAAALALPALGVALSRLSSQRVDRARFAVETVILALLFVPAWTALHTGLSVVLLPPMLGFAFSLAAGLALAAALDGCARLLGPGYASAFRVAVAAALVLGIDVVARFDDISAGARWSALGAVWFAVLVYGLVLGRITERVGDRARVGITGGFVVAACLALLAGGPSAARPPGAPSFLLIVVDTLRADALDPQAPLMPRLLELSRRGVRFSTCIAPAPWTLPSMVSLLSGRSPQRHGVGRSAGGPPARGGADASALAEALRSHGYQVASRVNNPYLRPYYGFGRGDLSFRRYHGRARDGADAALAWLRVHGSWPHLLMLHLMDPHWPYDAPAPFNADRGPCEDCDDLVRAQYSADDAAARTELRRRYDAEVRYTDAVIGEFVEELARLRGGLDPWIIVTADHGEEFWEHGRLLHGHSLYDELLRVPLVVVPPRGLDFAGAGRVVEEVVRLEDVGATIAELAGVEDFPGQGALGRSLLPLIEGQSDAPRAAVSGFLKEPPWYGWSVRSDEAKLVAVRPGLHVLFDLLRDPGETVNAIGSGTSPERRQELGPLVRDLRETASRAGIDTTDRNSKAPGQTGAATGAPTVQPIDPSLRRELEGLGYFDGAP